MDKVAGAAFIGVVFWAAMAMGMVIAIIIAICIIGAVAFVAGFPMLFFGGETAMTGAAFIVFGAITLTFSIPAVFGQSEQEKTANGCKGAHPYGDVKFVFTTSDGFVYPGGTVDYSVVSQDHASEASLGSTDASHILTFEYRDGDGCVTALYTPGTTYEPYDDVGDDATVKCELFVNGNKVDSDESEDRYDEVYCTDWYE